MYMGMSTKPAQRIGGYKLSRDDPTIFRDKNTFITCDRAFPEEEYPEGADSDVPLPLLSPPAVKLQMHQGNRSRSPEP